MRQVTEEQVREHLVKAASGYGGGRKFAQKAKISESIVARTKTKKMPVGIKIAQALGYWVRHEFDDGQRGFGSLTFWKKR